MYDCEKQTQLELKASSLIEDYFVTYKEKAMKSDPLLQQYLIFTRSASF